MEIIVLNILFVLFIFCILIILGCFYMLDRNHKVCKERNTVLDRIRKLINIDSEMIKDYKWRLEEYDKISYNEMLFKFWIPVKNFYKNHKCISSIDNN